jgi:cytochrome c nitrite reductase small subunit
MKPESPERTSRKLPFAAGLLVGILVAAFAALGYHGSGSASFCMSCHSMKEVGTLWQQSNHKQFACIDCHLPDDRFIAQISYKARAGLNDLYHETLRNYPAAIVISAEARSIARGNCLRCHYTTIEKTPMAEGGGDCLKCHHRLVHGRGPARGGIHVQ